MGDGRELDSDAFDSATFSTTGRKVTAEEVEAAMSGAGLEVVGRYAVLVADAWHWFPFDETVAEVRRVLRPGGSLGLVWNKVTPRERWELELAGIDPDLKGATEERPPEIPFPSDETQVASFPHVWRVTPQQYRDCLSTNSAVILMTDEDRRRRLEGAEALLTEVCRVEGTTTVGVRHEAFCLRWTPGSSRS